MCFTYCSIFYRSIYFHEPLPTVLLHKQVGIGFKINFPVNLQYNILLKISARYGFRKTAFKISDSQRSDRGRDALCGFAFTLR